MKKKYEKIQCAKLYTINKKITAICDIYGFSLSARAYELVAFCKTIFEIIMRSKIILDRHFGTHNKAVYEIRFLSIYLCAYNKTILTFVFYRKFIYFCRESDFDVSIDFFNGFIMKTVRNGHRVGSLPN